MRYAGIIENDTVDIDKGIAVSFWCQFCPHHCEGCHNPETWDKEGGYELPEDYIQQIIGLLKKNGIHRDLSILGGEPLCDFNIQIVYDLVKTVKEKDDSVRVFVWTGGIFKKLKETYQDIFRYIDILVDGSFLLKERDITLPLRGSNNQRVIDVSKSLKEGKTITIPDEKLNG